MGLRPRPHWGSLQPPSDPLAGFKGPTPKAPTPKGRGGERRGGKGRGEEDPEKLCTPKNSLE